MPYLEITTNITLTPGQKDTLMEQASRTLSTLLNKPELYIMVSVTTNQAMQLATTTDPCAYLILKSIDLPEDKTSTFSQKMCQFMEQSCGIDPQRTYIEFANVSRHMWGWKKGTFQK